MAQYSDIRKHLPLIRKCERAIKGAVINCYLENTEDERSKFLLGLTVQGARNIEAVGLLVNGKFYTQALGLCRSGLEAVAIANYVTQEQGSFKLLEKRFLERLRNELEEFDIPHNSDALGKYIKDAHSGSTHQLQMKALLAAFEQTTMPESRENLFYAGYRKLCSFTHPDFAILMGAVKVIGRKIRIEPDNHVSDDELSLGLGLAGAIGTCLLLSTQLGGIAFRPSDGKELESALNEAMDLVGKKDEGHSAREA